MDPMVADIIKVLLGAGSLYLVKAIRDLVVLRREGRSLKEANYVSNLSSALEREEKAHEQTVKEWKTEVATIKADLNHETDRFTYWRNYAGRLMFILTQNGIEFEQPKDDIVRRKRNERPE